MSDNQLFSTTAGTQLLIDRIVGYCSSVEIVRLCRVSKSFHTACSHPHVWRSLLATEWAIDVDALSRLHLRSMARTRTFVPAKVDEDEQPQEQEPTTPREQMLPPAPPPPSSSMVTPPRRLTDSRRFPLSPSGSPHRALNDAAATEDEEESPIREELLRAPPPYCWKAVLRLVHEHRVTKWQRHLSTLRGNSQEQQQEPPPLSAMRQQELETRIAGLDQSIEAQLQSGVCRGQVHHRRFLAHDLLLQARMLTQLARVCAQEKSASMTAANPPLAVSPTARYVEALRIAGDNTDSNDSSAVLLDAAIANSSSTADTSASDIEPAPVDSSVVISEEIAAYSPGTRELYMRALGDAALVLLLLDFHGDELADARAAQLLAAEVTASLGSAPFADPAFDFDQAYDHVQATGSSRERAAFLHRCEFWRGPSYTHKLQSYSVGDGLKVWPERIMREARRCATTEAHRLCCDAWMMFDRQDIDGAQRTIELAVSLVPTCSCFKKKINAAQMTNGSGNDSSTRNSVGRMPSQIAVPCAATHLPSNTNSAEPFARAGPDVVNGGGDDAGCCPTCRKPVLLSAADSFVWFSSGFIAQQSLDAIDAYLTSLRGCREVGRRAITCNNIGTIFFHFKDYRAAAAWHRAAVAPACNPNYYLPYKNLARCYGALNDVPQALAAINSAIQLCRPLPAEAYAERSKYWAQHRELAICQRVCPRLSYPYRLRSAIFMDQGAFDSALAELTRIVDLKLEPNDLSLRAVFNRDAHRDPASVRDMQLALTLDPSNSTFSRWLEKNAPHGAPFVYYSD